MSTSKIFALAYTKFEQELSSMWNKFDFKLELIAGKQSNSSDVGQIVFQQQNVYKYQDYANREVLKFLSIGPKHLLSTLCGTQ